MRMPLDQPEFTELPLLKTKITAPHSPPGFVHRPRLTERLEQGVSWPLMLLSAPAGYGKTNLLVEWMAETHYPVAWLSLDSEDNDFNRFFRYLTGALQSVEPDLGEEALDFIQSTRGSEPEVGLTLLINAIAALPKRLVLVLDDFQVIEEPIILRSINFFIKNIPANLHLMIASRSEPALDLASLRAKGRMQELGMEDLRFTSEEVALFFEQVMGMRLLPETIQALEERTDGWIIGLQMAGISLRNQPDPNTLLASFQGPGHYLVDFLAEEVLDQQQEDVRQFLLRSSVLKTMCGPLCEAVVKPDAQPGYGLVMLNRLEHANLFIIALDEKHEWFRYQNLFADFLFHIESETNPSEIPELQKRAALWFEQNGDLDEAFRYALASRDMEWTADLIERNLETILKTGEIYSLTRWLSQLPNNIIHRHPFLGLAYAWGSIAAYQVDNALYWIDDVQQVLDQMEKQSKAGGSRAEANELRTLGKDRSDGLWNIRGGLAVCRSTLALLNSDAEQAAQFSKQAVDSLNEESPFIRSLLALDNSLYHVLSGDTSKAIESLHKTIRVARQANNLMVMVIATCQLAEMQFLQGQLDLSLATYHKAQYMSIGPDGKPLLIAGLVDIGLGEILLERNSLAEANAFLEHGIQTTGTLWWLSNLDALISLARLRQVQGDIDGSRAIIAQAEQLALSTDSSQWDDTLISAAATRLALQRGDLAEAEQWWNKSANPDFTASIPLEDYPYHIYEYLVITQARLLLAIGHHQGNQSYFRQALELLESLLLEARRLRRVTSQIEIQVLQSILLFALGETEASVKTLQIALAMGEPQGYRRIYLDEGWAIAEIMIRCEHKLKATDDQLPSAAFVNNLLAALRSTAVSVPALPAADAAPREAFTVKTEDGVTISLSLREIEVLSLIAEGKSNQEISNQLYLTLNTVKRHAYNIYAKLDVKNRTQAVSKARRLGLIP